MDITKKILLLTLFQGLVCQRWEFPSEIVGLVGSCVEIPCTFHPHENPGTSSIVWYLYQRRGYPQIFNSHENSSVLMDYKNRTSLVPGRNSCSLMIDPVRREDDNKYYYPGIAEDVYTNAYSESSTYLQLHVTDNPTILELTGNKEMLEVHSETFQCSVVHTCGSNPPSLKWNKAGQTERRSEDLSEGKWKEILTITYIPSYEDDKTQIQCTATYPNERTSENATTLSIRYGPKDVTVSYPENEEFMEGSDVTLTCSSNSNPPPHTYEWCLGNCKTKLRLEKRITVQNVSKETEPYSCAAINKVGRGESPPTQIPVQYPATGVQVIVFPKEGATELNCSFVSSHPNVTHYTWIKDGNILLKKTKQILVLDSNEDKSGSYSCIAHNTAGSSTSAELDFKDTPRLSKLTENGEMLEGRPEILACSVVHTRVSNPPSLEWNKPGQTERRSEKLSGGKWREILTITFVPSHKDDETQMKCTATYHNGEKSHKATTLNINYAATGVQVIVLQTEGGTELNCSFVSSHPNVTHYTWIKHGNILINKTEQILVLDSNEDKSGSYSCIAHNTAGSSTSAELDFADLKTDKDSTDIKDNFNLFLILGILAGVILLIVIVYFSIRKKKIRNKARQASSSHENSQQPDATYTDLMKTEVSNDYDTLKTSFSVPPAARRRDLPSDNHYENLHRK